MVRQQKKVGKRCLLSVNWINPGLVWIGFIPLKLNFELTNVTWKQKCICISRSSVRIQSLQLTQPWWRHWNPSDRRESGATSLSCQELEVITTNFFFFFDDEEKENAENNQIKTGFNTAVYYGLRTSLLESMRLYNLLHCSVKMWVCFWKSTRPCNYTSVYVFWSIYVPRCTSLCASLLIVDLRDAKKVVPTVA